MNTSVKGKYFYEGKFRSTEELKKIFKHYRSINRFKVVYSLIHGNQNRILDIGCGAGYLSNFYSDKILEYIGADIIKSNINIANCFFKNDKSSFVQGNIFSKKNKLIKENYFDYVLLLEVIEHVDNPAEFVNNALRFIKKGGYLIISTPNAASLTNLLFNLKYREKIVTAFDFNGTETDHIYSWDRVTLQNLLVKLGLKIIVVRLSKSTITKGQSVIIKTQKM